MGLQTICLKEENNKEFMPMITASVGQRGANKIDDTKYIQELLNLHIDRMALHPLKVDGRCGQVTIRFIKLFQKKIVGLARPDGRIDPNGKTIKNLKSEKTYTKQSYNNIQQEVLQSTKKILKVNYLFQPNNNTCQGTCLKMFASFIGLKASGKNLTEQAIKTAINTGKKRPVTTGKLRHNNHANMRWWLENNSFWIDDKKKRWFTKTSQAVAYVKNRIDNNLPVIVSVSHSRVSGHVILAIGYINYNKNQPANTKFVCHDPFGAFNPQLTPNKNPNGENRKQRVVIEAKFLCIEGAYPGESVILNHNGIRRVNKSKYRFIT